LNVGAVGVLSKITRLIALSLPASTGAGPEPERSLYRDVR